MDQKFELSGLSSVFQESMIRNEPTLVFEIKNGRGRFLFMMFFDKEDISTKDDLFIYMKNTNMIVKLKLYGNHSKGQFNIWLPPTKMQLFIKELKIDNQNKPTTPFNFDRFFHDLNNTIPKTISLKEKIIDLRGAWIDVKDKLPQDVVDDHEKTILVGPMQLPSNKSPREKTLRKLYLISEESAESVTELIDRLKRLKITLMWTSDPLKQSKSIASILRGL